MYFKEFPIISYMFNIGGKNELRAVKDITLNVRVRKEILANLALYDEYDIQDGETVEKIAHKFYGNTGYHWVLMLANERFDPVADFPLSQSALEDYVLTKYGSSNRDSQHTLFGYPHFELPSGKVVDQYTPLAQPVSNYDYEFTENEKKRRIKIVSPNIINKLVSDLEDAFVEGQ